MPEHSGATIRSHSRMRPHVSVATIATRRGRTLMITRSSAPCAGKLSLPGGHVEFGERLEDAAVRELREETGLEGRITASIGYRNLVFRDGGRSYHVVMFFFRATVADGPPKKGPDVRGASWVNLQIEESRSICPPILRFLKDEGIV